MKKISLTLFAALALALSSASGISFAERGSHMEGHDMKGHGEVAIDGHCPVCVTKGKVVMGSKNFATEYNGKVYYFPGIEQQKMFVNNPEAYLDGVKEKYKELKMKSGGSGMKGSY